MAILAAMGIFSVQSASALQGAEAAGLAGTHWRLVALGQVGSEELVPSLYSITLEFIDANRFGGRGACNFYNATYRTEGTNFSVTAPISSTAMACTPVERMDQDANYFAALADAATYAISGDKLLLTSASNQQMIFVRVFPLQNGVWHLRSYGMSGGPAVSGFTVLPESTVSLGFQLDSRVVGSGGCNSFGGSYNVGAVGDTGTALTISNLIATLKACADNNLMQQEQIYFNALQGATAYRLNGDTLEIAYGTQELLTFERVLAFNHSQWRLLAYGKEGQEIPTAPNAVTTLRIQNDTLSGYGGCNTYTGKLAVEGQAITISEVASTLRACLEPAVMAQEADFFKYLAAAKTYTLSDGQLTLILESGERLIFELLLPERRSIAGMP
ncbi:MAG: hypothetical protein OHK0023_00210 [Anaerolineae bacterium]